MYLETAKSSIVSCSAMKFIKKTCLKKKLPWSCGQLVCISALLSLIVLSQCPSILTSVYLSLGIRVVNYFYVLSIWHRARHK